MSSTYLIQVTKFYVVDLNDIQIVHLQALHALLDSLCDIIALKVEVSGISTTLCGQDDLVTRQGLQRLSQSLHFMDVTCHCMQMWTDTDSQANETPENWDFCLSPS